MAQFRLAQPRDLPRLTALWQEAFGDGKAAVEDFWTRCFAHIRVFCLFEQQALLAMACALPLSYTDMGGETYTCPYFYAVATAETQRGKGHCRSLLSQAEAYLKKEGASLCCLVPQGEALFRFYGKLGYRSAFTVAEHSLPAKRGSAKIKKIDTATYENFRQIQLYGEFLAYPDFLLQLQQATGAATGAGLYLLESGEKLCVAAAEKRCEILLIKEMLPADGALAAHLAATLGCKEVILRSPAQPGEGRAFGMAKALVPHIPLPEEAYLGLAFD